MLELAQKIRADFYSLKTRLQALHINEVGVSDPIYKKLVTTYIKRITSELNRILSEKSIEKTHELLMGFLQENRALTKGTCLSYTAFQTDHTDILFDCADTLAAYLNQRLPADTPPTTGLALLMPDLSSLMSLDFAYPHLVAITACSWSTADDNALTDTKLTEGERQMLRARKEEFIAEQGFIQAGVYERKGDWLVPNIPSKIILRTHIMTSDQTSLIPIKAIVDDPKFRPYASEVKTEQDVEAEMLRCKTHSPSTRSLFDAREDVLQLREDKSTLLGNLVHLCHHLRLNDAYFGVGRHNEAGSGFYPAILTFREYYRSLDPEDIKKIPISVSKEIELILNLAFDQQTNAQKITTIETCLAHRRSKLEKIITNTDAFMLSEIACNDQRKAQLLLAAEQKVQLARSNLLGLCIAGSYKGEDKLPLSMALIDALKISVKIKSLVDLELIVSLTPEEIKTIFAANERKQEIATLFHNGLNDFVLFIHNTTVPKIEVIFETTFPNLLNSICQKTGRYGQFENCLSGILATLTDKKLLLTFLWLLKHNLNGVSVHQLFATPPVFKEFLEKLAPSGRVQALTTKNYAGVNFFSASEIFTTYLMDNIALIPQNQMLEFIKHEEHIEQHIEQHLPITTLILILNSITNNITQFNEAEAMGLFLRLIKNKLNTKNAGVILHLLTSLSRDAQSRLMSSEPSLLQNALDCYPKFLPQLASILPRQYWISREKIDLFLEKREVFTLFLSEIVKFDLELLTIVFNAIPEMQRFAFVTDGVEHTTLLFAIAAQDPGTALSILKLIPEDLRLKAITFNNRSGGNNLLAHSVENPVLFRSLLALFPPDQRYDVLWFTLDKTQYPNKRVLIMAVDNPGCLKILSELLPEAGFITLVCDPQMIFSITQFETLQFFLNCTPKDKRLQLMTAKDQDGSTCLNHIVKFCNDGNILKKLDSLLAMIPAKERVEAISASARLLFSQLKPVCEDIFSELYYFISDNSLDARKQAQKLPVDFFNKIAFLELFSKSVHHALFMTHRREYTQYVFSEKKEVHKEADLLYSYHCFLKKMCSPEGAEEIMNDMLNVCFELTYEKYQKLKKIHDDIKKNSPIEPSSINFRFFTDNEKVLLSQYENKGGLFANTVLRYNEVLSKIN